MPDPIHVENAFQELVFELRQTSSVRQRYAMIREFTDLLEGQFRKYDSYLLQILSEIPLYSTPLTYSGLDPELIEQDIRLLREIQEQVADLQDHKRFREGIDNLQLVSILLYSFTGDWKKTETHLSEWLGKPVTVGIAAAATEEIHAGRAALERFFESIDQLLNECSEGESLVRQKIQALIREVDYCLSDQPDTALVPVVERSEGLTGDIKRIGRLRRIRVDVKSEIKNDADRLIRRFNVYGVEQPLWLVDEEVLSASRHLVKEDETELKTKRFSGEIYYELSGAMHEGGSANAAMAVLWYTGLQRFLDLRDRYEVCSTVCMTGNVTEEGKLLPVDEECIESKLHAAFFSWSPYFVVPSAQLDKFQTYLVQLRNKYPNRNLTLLGIEYLEHLFFDRRLTRHIDPSRLRYTLQKAWQKKFETAGVVTILFLAAIVFRLSYGPMDQNPVLNTFTGEMLQVKNQSGMVLEEIHVGERTVNRTKSDPRRQYASFADLTGDGRNEIIWSQLDSENPSFVRGYLKSKALKGNEPIWRESLRYDLYFRQKPYLVESNYTAEIIHIEDLNTDGRKDLLVTMNHAIYFPGILSLRDLSTGVERSHFFNTGHIRDFTTADITGDGRKEVIICGVNNAYGMAFVAVLDPVQINGMSPATPEYEPEGYETASNLRYLLIPMTEVGESVIMGRNYNLAERISVKEDEQVIRVYVQDYVQYDGSEVELPASRATIQIYFNYDLSVRGIGTADGFDATAEFLYQEGRLDRLPDYHYFEDYQEQILYWDGEGFR